MLQREHDGVMQLVTRRASLGGEYAASSASPGAADEADMSESSLRLGRRNSDQDRWAELLALADSELSQSADWRAQTSLAQADASLSQSAEWREEQQTSMVQSPASAGGGGSILGALSPRYGDGEEAVSPPGGGMGSSPSVLAGSSARTPAGTPRSGHERGRDSGEHTTQVRSTPGGGGANEDANVIASMSFEEEFELRRVLQGGLGGDNDRTPGSPAPSSAYVDDLRAETSPAGGGALHNGGGGPGSCGLCGKPLGERKGRWFRRSSRPKGRMCYYTRRLCCEECHDNDKVAIPQHIIYSWDHTPRTVCRRAKEYVDKSLQLYYFKYNIQCSDSHILYTEE